jgi:hypothetical protein
VQVLELQKQQSLWPGKALGQNLSAQNSSLDFNNTWDGTSLGLVQGLVLQKIAEPLAWRSTYKQLGRTKQKLGLEKNLEWNVDEAFAGPGASKNSRVAGLEKQYFGR